MTEDEMYDIIRGYEDSERHYNERNIELEAENAKLQERVEWLDGECRKSMGASHKFFEMVNEYQKENTKLRELCEDMLSCIEIREAFCRPPTAEMCKEFADCARELGIEVDA